MDGIKKASNIDMHNLDVDEPLSYKHVMMILIVTTNVCIVRDKLEGNRLLFKVTGACLKGEHIIVLFSMKEHCQYWFVLRYFSSSVSW